MIKKCIAIYRGEKQSVGNNIVLHKGQDDFIRFLALLPVEGQTPVYVRAEYSVVTHEYVKFFTRREHYFAYLGDIVEKGYAGWTDTIRGKTKSEKVNTLHEGGKQIYAEKYLGYTFSLADDRVSSKLKERDAADGGNIISYEKAYEYMVWWMKALYERHLEATKDCEGGAWSIEPFNNME